MKRFFSLLFLGSLLMGLFGGCSSGPADDPAPKGTIPEAKQADPSMKAPEQRGESGGGEGS